jgi:hypothetical protein
VYDIFKTSLKIPKGGNQNPEIEEEQTTQWLKENEQKCKQRSTKHTHKTKDRVTRTPRGVTISNVGYLVFGPSAYLLTKIF